MNRRFLLAGLAMLVGAGIPGSAGPAAVAGQPPARRERDHPLKATLLADRTAAVPGQTLLLGVRLEIRDGWHTYWPGDNDTGAPTTFAFHFPDGFAPGPVRWPAPTRHIGAGDLLDYVYEGQTLLVIPVTVPADAAVGTTVRLAVDAEWLVCRETCIPGRASLSVTLPVAAKSAPGAEAGLFAEAAARTPKPLDPGQPAVDVRWNGPAVTLIAPGAGEVEFFVAESSAKPGDPIRSCAANGDRLTLRLEDPHKDRPNLRGVLVARFTTPPGRPPEFHAIDLPRPKTP